MKSALLCRGPALGFAAYLLASFALASFARAADAPATATDAPAPAFWKFADKPPMGWNSWDCFGTTVTEAQTKAEADYLAKNLKEHGWQYIVVDIEWYEAGNKAPRDVQNYLGNPYLVQGERYRGMAQYSLDDFGRFVPAPNRFPSSANGAGFKALADYIHGLGLKFGIHMMRGIPREAVAKNLPIKGTDFHAADIADKSSLCLWNPDMYGVDLSKPGAQEYYNSVFALLAQWGVDFVKVDDIARPYHRQEIEAIRKAIDLSGRPMVLSLSPGATPIADAANVEQNANMWRVSDDFWDTWKDARGGGLFPQFARLRDWTPFRGPGHFPDGDMLPLGLVKLNQPTKFTHDEQYTLMTLWSIARSPLIAGGDLTKTDDFTLSLLTNDEVLAVDQNSANNHELFNKNGFIAWIADVPGSPDKYVAVFNTNESVLGPATIPVKLADCGFSGMVRVRDLWMQQNLYETKNEFASAVNPHGAHLYRLTPIKAEAVAPATTAH